MNYIYNSIAAFIISVMPMSFAIAQNFSTSQSQPTQLSQVQKDTVYIQQPKKHLIGDYLSIGGWIDGQYSYEYQSKSDGSTVTDINTFQIRRARLDIKGDITKKIGFRLQADLSNSPKIVDAFVKVKFNKYISFQAGQFKIPLTLETPYSPLNLETIENAIAVSKLSGYKDVSGVKSYANGRDIGIMLSGVLAEFKRNGEKYPLIKYDLGVFNGNGINVKDNNKQKDFAGRLTIYPFLKNLALAGSAYIGNYNIPDTSTNGDRIRYSGGFEYKDERWTLRSEYIYGSTGYYDNISYKVDNTTSKGAYAVIGYWFKYNCGKNGKLEQKIRPVFRYDYYKENTTTKLYYTFGADWWLEKHLRLQINYTLRDEGKYDKLGHAISTMLSIKF